MLRNFEKNMQLKYCEIKMFISVVQLFLLVSTFQLWFVVAFFPNYNRHSDIHSFSYLKSLQLPSLYRYTPQLYAIPDDNDNEEDDDDDEIVGINLSEQDWREFRAKLVMGETLSIQSSTKNSSTTIESDNDLDGIGALFSSSSEKSVDEQTKEMLQGMTPLDPSQWAYESGTVIEQGAIILGGVEQDYGFGLRQQYFHKCAILVLDHTERKFTKGIILNRPTDLMLDDDINPGVKWRIWFGGDVQGFNSGNPEIVCLHSLQNDQTLRASLPVMKDIKWTSFESAKRLVKAGAAKASDFWVFCGYAGWGSGQLMGELDRKSWYMVATDSQTLLKELSRQSAGSDPRDAGLDTWALLMNMIGRADTVRKYTGGFDDLMLKEWAFQNLLSKAAGGEGELGLDVKPNIFGLPARKRLFNASLKGKAKAGNLLRATSIARSPFLLEDQELHKSVILVLTFDSDVFVGVILSRPAAKGLDIQITDKGSLISRTIQVPLRYGGQCAVKGSEPILWLHCNASLKKARIGSPIGDTEGIWKCTSSDVISAIGQGIASPEQFMAISGVLVLSIGQDDENQSADPERFEIIPDSNTFEIYEELSKQQVLSSTNLESNLNIACHAWAKGASNDKKETNGMQDLPPIVGLGEGFDEDDDTMVFKSSVKVSKLCDDALHNWVSTFLLGSPLRQT